jgi:hypothetical protein
MAVIERRVLNEQEASPASSRPSNVTEVAMTSQTKRGSKSRRIVTFAALAAIVTALSGCVIYPIGGGYYHPYGFHDHDRGWH